MFLEEARKRASKEKGKKEKNKTKEQTGEAAINTTEAKARGVQSRERSAAQENSRSEKGISRYQASEKFSKSKR